MRQFFLLILVGFIALQQGYGQNRATTKISITPKTQVSLLNTGNGQTSHPTIPVADNKAEPAGFPLFHFNDSPIIKLFRAPVKPVRFFTQLSFSDILENHMNGLQINLLNTYDDMVPELFSEAPSVFKITCIINL